jgi:hypothetical protein
MIMVDPLSMDLLPLYHQQSEVVIQASPSIRLWSGVIPGRADSPAAMFLVPLTFR